MKIYVATSWKNTRQPGVVKALRDAGHDVYDFRKPKPGTSGFQWSDIDPDWKDWPPAKYRDALTDPLAKSGFDRDFNAMQWADAFVLVMPCGASAHLEAGWAIGQGKPTCILIGDKQQAELMYKMASSIVLNKSGTIGMAERGWRGIGPWAATPTGAVWAAWRFCLMTPAQLNRSLRSVGMKCFVSYFEELSDPFLSNGAVSEILVERAFYTEKAGRSRTSTARRIIKEGYARDSLLMVASAKKSGTMGYGESP